mmetsp:Transcript_8293/g.29123  ORF Transcript_8293/g.29123 Transcript_8293/m.29123 type:complete len:259 (+) Transcript_8293:1555-2331(+)
MGPTTLPLYDARPPTLATTSCLVPPKIPWVSDVTGLPLSLASESSGKPLSASTDDQSAISLLASSRHRSCPNPGSPLSSWFGGSTLRSLLPPRWRRCRAGIAASRSTSPQSRIALSSRLSTLSSGKHVTCPCAGKGSSASPSSPPADRARMPLSHRCSCCSAGRHGARSSTCAHVMPDPLRMRSCSASNLGVRGGPCGQHPRTRLRLSTRSLGSSCASLLTSSHDGSGLPCRSTITALGVAPLASPAAPTDATHASGR